MPLVSDPSHAARSTVRVGPRQIAIPAWADVEERAQPIMKHIPASARC
jgi:hypothetical protein